ncbi:MAG: hypothetical protein GY861_02900 [bacterium]|nr:hypothetical protein [bacterium]
MQETRYDISERLDGGLVEKLRQTFVEGDTTKKIQQKMNKELDELVELGAEIKTVKRVKIGRNESCPCGSGNKFKKCCIFKLK